MSSHMSSIATPSLQSDVWGFSYTMITVSTKKIDLLSFMYKTWFFNAFLKAFLTYL